MRPVCAFLALALVACGPQPSNSGLEPGTTPPETAPTTASASTASTIAAGTTGDGAVPDTPAASPPSSAVTDPPVGERAPDFSLALGDGGTFVLSDETRPVYLVFWAEW